MGCMNAQSVSPLFLPERCLVATRASVDWDLIIGHGPVLATAIHDGHAIRKSLQPYLAIDPQQRRREEDPMTGMLTTVADVRLRVRTSRFEVDLNRPRDKAVPDDPADTWGLRVWRQALPDHEISQSLAIHDDFYTTIRALLDAMIEQWGCVLLLDLHSYNHRRDGANAAPAPSAGNPDIELGVTTLDHRRWGSVLQRFTEALQIGRAHV